MCGFAEKLLRPLLLFIDVTKQIIKHAIIKTNIKLEHSFDIRILDILTKYYDVDVISYIINYVIIYVIS